MSSDNLPYAQSDKVKHKQKMRNAPVVFTAIKNHRDTAQFVYLQLKLITI